jgi:hypothetical protein
MKLKLTKDSNELLLSYVSTFIECYKVFIACLLAVFVPQYCPETKTTCTLNENFSNLTRFNEFVLFYNFFSLFSFIYLYYIQSKRETYFISHLEVNKDKSDNSLEENLKDYSKIMNKVNYYNLHIHKVSKLSIINFYINALFSSILIYYYYYDGFRSVTTLVTSVLLVSQKLYSTFNISKNCIGDKKFALSLISLEPVSFNDVDPEYVTRRDSCIKDINLQIYSGPIENKNNDDEKNK